MGLRKMVSRIPGLRYIEEVRQGTQEQKERADRLRETVMPLAVSVAHMYRQNHFSPMVDEVFKGRHSK